MNLYRYNFLPTLQQAKRSYSTKSSNNNLVAKNSLTPVKATPIFTLDKLYDKLHIDSNREILKNKGGIYSFINTVDGKQYIGSAKDFYLRLNEHLNNKKSRACAVNLQRAINKYGLDKFN
jgi:hypothetical protein